MVEREPWIDRITAREQIDGGKSVLGPRMNREVRLRDDDNSRHTVRREPVNEVLNRGSPRARHCGEKLAAYALRGV